MLACQSQYYLKSPSQGCIGASEAALVTEAVSHWNIGVCCPPAPGLSLPSACTAPAQPSAAQPLPLVMPHGCVRTTETPSSPVSGAAPAQAHTHRNSLQPGCITGDLSTVWHTYACGGVPAGGLEDGTVRTFWLSMTMSAALMAAVRAALLPGLPCHRVVHNGIKRYPLPPAAV